ncbi:hypothetical protein ACS0TY_026233 [Phlomoides rotata]
MLMRNINKKLGMCKQNKVDCEETGKSHHRSTYNKWKKNWQQGFDIYNDIDKCRSNIASAF